MTPFVFHPEPSCWTGSKRPTGVSGFIVNERHSGRRKGESVRARALLSPNPFACSIFNDCCPNGKDASTTTQTSHDHNFAEANVLRFKLLVGLATEGTDSVATIVSPQSRLVNSGNAIKASVTFTANLVALTFIGLIGCRVNVHT